MSQRRLVGVGWILALCALLLAPAAPAEEAAPAPAAAPAATAVPAPAPAPATAARPVREMNLFVKEWSWDPEVLRIKKGSHVILHIESLDGARSFVLKPYKVKAALPEGERITVEFDVDQEGTFEFRCGRPCGNGCAKLRGNLIVY